MNTVIPMSNDTKTWGSGIIEFACAIHVWKNVLSRFKQNKSEKSIVSMKLKG